MAAFNEDSTFTVQGNVRITAATYQQDRYRNRSTGFRLQVFDEDLLSPDDCLCEVPLRYVRHADHAGEHADLYRFDAFEIDGTDYLRSGDRLDRGEPELLFHVVYQDEEDDVRLKTKTPLRGALGGTTGEETMTLYSGPNAVGQVAATVTAQLPAREGASTRSAGASTKIPRYPDQAVASIHSKESADGLTKEIRVRSDIAQNMASPQISLRRPDLQPSEDQPLWVAIRNRTNAIGFDNYQAFLDEVFCEVEGEVGLSTDRGRCNTAEVEAVEASLADAHASLRTHIGSVNAYKLLDVATEAFLLLHCGVHIDDAYRETEEASRLGDTIPSADIRTRLRDYLGTPERLPYLDQIISNLSLTANTPDLCGPGYLRTRVNCPCLIELIWSYWQEEGMLVQTMNAISMRFQNRRVSERNVLANLEIDPLRPLNNLLWGFIQDELHRLTVPRRAYEYDHHYGLRLAGRAVPALQAADSRSKFIEAFHNLLQRAALFYQEDADLNVVSDGFQLLNALKEVHLILAYGAHNQFGDLPWTARKEMLIMQWLLARPEMRDFLGGRAMVPYTEGWMAQVDTMKQLQRWTDTSVTHFRDLAVFGEQLLLSIRYGNWADVNDQNQAKNWARYWRPEVQSYIYAYQSATSVDLSADSVSTSRAQARYLQPSVHLQRQINKQPDHRQLSPSTNHQPTMQQKQRRPQGKPAPRLANPNGRG